MVLVQEIVSEAKIVLSPDTSINVALKECIDKDFYMAPVVDNNKFYGMFKISSVFKFETTKLKKTVKDVMDSSCPVVLKDTLVSEIPRDFCLFLPVIDHDNNYLGIISTADILNSFEESIHYSLSSLRSLIDSTNNGIIAIDKRGVITIFNTSARRILGISDSNVIGKYIIDVLPKTRLPWILKTGKPEFNVKTEFEPAKKLFANYSPIMNNGELIGAVAVFQDFSELESVSEELNRVKSLNKQLDAIINSSYDGIWITDHKGKTLKVNDAIERITGLSRDECIGRYMRDMELDGTVDESVTMKVLNEKKSVTLVQNVSTGRQTIVTGNPVFDDEGNIIYVVTNVRDITELSKLKEKLIQAKDLTNRYKNEINELKLKLVQQEDIIARSKLMQNILDLVSKVSMVDSTVLITGESGVGKEVVARLVHRLSARNEQGRFVTINCGAIPENLLESELFGYEKGAFTGAKKEGKPGLFEVADKGTLFLDEVSELPLEMQVKLLRVLQEQEIMRIGGVKTVKVDVRVIAATNKNLFNLTHEGKFREDLYYRLNVIPIDIPPLRKRPEDISALISHYLYKFNNKFKTKKVISSETVDYLLNYSWPGNVRELINILERLIITTRGDLITFSDLPAHIKTSTHVSGATKKQEFIPLKEALEQYEREIIASAMEVYGSTRKVAKMLGVSQSTVSRRVRKLISN
ncbi:sigma 54-interacting transcriptional regulator [Desulfallas sp. Bu1-1]|uniref:sigma-54-dependent Fis family transcriptional regulator n=1 Tax=Desulfallas sp. Bu1-1 TaxID=2787620 RepID=UPI00189C9DC8|nr:sigma-54-dependent Fis family transcriptional regulator [Desulfallas sp. Bu1-1]MBF7083853.1 sigma 54-interacting transcriptional regulator [Desulfallas sp. Bu1-1]